MITIKQPILQQGAALITSLVILLILTVLGISAMGTTSMEELMTGNLRDQIISFQAAESGLSDGEREVDTWPVSGAPLANLTGSNGVYLKDALLQPNTPYLDYAEGAFDDALIWGNATMYGLVTGAIPLDPLNLAAQPVYIIEEVQLIPQEADADSTRHPKPGSSIGYYKITAKGRGLSNNAVTLLQTTIAHRY
jgi:type IV pilus assembly protein PilX